MTAGRRACTTGILARISTRAAGASQPRRQRATPRPPSEVGVTLSKLARADDAPKPVLFVGLRASRGVMVVTRGRVVRCVGSGCEQEKRCEERTVLDNYIRPL